jgi:hypothetical protein
MTVTRITNALAEGFPWITPEYSASCSFAPLSVDPLAVALIAVDHVKLYTPNGGCFNDTMLRADSRPRWMTDNEISFRYGNAWMRFDGANYGPVKMFPEFSSIDDNGEADILLTPDGMKRVTVGDKRVIFVTNLTTGETGKRFITPGDFDSVYLTPKGNVLVSWEDKGPTEYHGMDLFDGDMMFLRHIENVNGHKGVCLDQNGDEVLIWTNSDDPDPGLNAKNAICKVRLADGQSTVLLELDWSLAVHISCPTQAGFCFVSTEQAATSTVACDHRNKIMKIGFDGTVTDLCDHGPTSSYNSQAKVTASRDGTCALFASNHDRQADAPYDANYADTYLVTVSAPNVL